MLNQCNKYCHFKSCDWYLHRVHNTENIKAFLKHHYMHKQLFVKVLSMFLHIVYNLNFQCLTGLALWSGRGVCDVKQNIAISKGLLHSWEILPMSHTPWQHGIRINNAIC